MLTREKERQLIQDWQDNGSEASFNKAMSEFEPLFKKWSWRRPNPDDAMQECRMAFLKAMDTFDLSAGTRLSTHVRWMIRGALKSGNDKRYFRNRGLEVDMLNRTIPSDEGDGREYVDTIVDPRRGGESASKYIREAMSALKPRERSVLVARANDFTLIDIASVLGVSKQAVQQIEARAIGKMRSRLHPSTALYVQDDPYPTDNMVAMFTD